MGNSNYANVTDNLFKKNIFTALDHLFEKRADKGKKHTLNIVFLTAEAVLVIAFTLPPPHPPPPLQFRTKLF
jgi:hypothetical protein